MPLVLSVVIPVYNEFATLEMLIDRVRAVKLPGDMTMEIILVDDYSTDGTRKLYKDLRKKVDRIILHRRNQGKGAALRSGFKVATGDFLIVQDADLEYDPNEYCRLLPPLLQDKADVVYGSRFLGQGEHRVLYFWHTVGNRVLTLLSNMFTNLNLTDMETCYKLFRRSILDGIEIEQNRFGFEPEITAKLAKRNVRFYEIGISYHGRTYEEGKKIGLKDAFQALYCIIRYSRGRYKDIGRSTLQKMEGAGKYGEWIYEVLKPYIGKRVLEFGSGLGSLARFLTDRDHLYITDYTEGYLPNLQRRFGTLHNVEIHHLDICKPTPYLLQQDIDTVISCNVVEHIEDDLAALKGAYSLLKPGGRCVILVPAHQVLYSPMDTNLEHFRRYNRDLITKRMQAAGFEVEDCFYMNMFGAIGWFGAGVILRQSAISNFSLALHKLVQPVTQVLDRFFGGRPPFGLSVIAIGRKR